MLTHRSTRVAERMPRILAHPFEFTVALMFLITGGNSINVLIHVRSQLRIGLLALPLPLLWVWILAIVLGALLIVASYVQPVTKLMVRATERAGLCLAGAAWTCIAIVLIHLDPGHPAMWLQYVAITLGCVLRLWAMHRYEKGLRKAAEVIGSDS